MLIKPSNLTSLPSDSRSVNSFPISGVGKRDNSVESEGRLMRLELVEKDIRKMKQVHDIVMSHFCIGPWYICTCDHAFYTRARDIGLDSRRVLHLRGIL